MRMPILIAAGIAALVITACDQATSPIVARLGGDSPASGSSGGSTAGTNGTTTPLAIAPNQLGLTVGGTFTLTTNAPVALQNQLEWRSAEPNIAAVSEAGVVTGIAPGTAVVTARYSFDTTQSASAIVSVAGAGTP